MSINWSISPRFLSDFEHFNSFNGYQTAVTIGKLDLEAITQIEEFSRHIENFPNLTALENVCDNPQEIHFIKDLIFGFYANDISNFKFLPGDFDLIYEIVSFVDRKTYRPDSSKSCSNYADYAYFHHDGNVMYTYIIDTAIGELFCSPNQRLPKKRKKKSNAKNCIINPTTAIQLEKTELTTICRQLIDWLNNNYKKQVDLEIKKFLYSNPIERTYIRELGVSADNPNVKIIINEKDVNNFIENCMKPSNEVQTTEELRSIRGKVHCYCNNVKQNGSELAIHVSFRVSNQLKSLVVMGEVNEVSQSTCTTGWALNNFTRHLKTHKKKHNDPLNGLGSLFVELGGKI